MKMFKEIYAKKETLLGLALDIYECKSEVNEVFQHYLYQKEKQAGEFAPEFQ